MTRPGSPSRPRLGAAAALGLMLPLGSVGRESLFNPVDQLPQRQETIDVPPAVAVAANDDSQGRVSEKHRVGRGVYFTSSRTAAAGELLVDRPRIDAEAPYPVEELSDLGWRNIEMSVEPHKVRL